MHNQSLQATHWISGSTTAVHTAGPKNMYMGALTSRDSECAEFRIPACESV